MKDHRFDVQKVYSAAHCHDVQAGQSLIDPEFAARIHLDIEVGLIIQRMEVDTHRIGIGIGQPSMQAAATGVASGFPQSL